MKATLKKYFLVYQNKIITALILTAILSIGGGLTIINNAVADSPLRTERNTELLSRERQNSLPSVVSKAVLTDLASKQGIDIKELKIIDYRQQTWSNGCLDLAQPNEMCTQALVPGWRVVIAHNQQNWIYHTNSNGRSLRLATTNNPSDSSINLPEAIKNAVVRDASTRSTTKVAVTPQNITEVEKVVWSNGCLDIGGGICTFALVPGWRVTVTVAEEQFIYHTDEDSLVKFNPDASQKL
ncbi:hypothetical protein [Nodularia chucula]|uniref:hypothetical protein n=1 Tax=Nodularia chucula TaxID=3093667 RepID=UPI0039C68107